MTKKPTAKPLPPVLEELAEQLSHLGQVTSGRFFGGHDLRINGIQVLAVIRGTLYLKTDGDLAEALAALGGEPFRYRRGDRETVVRAYHSIPPELLDDPDALTTWVIRALRASA